MKKIYSSLWLLLAILQQVLAQNNDTTMSPVVFGTVGDNAYTTQNHTNTSISFMIGQAFVLVDNTTPFDTTRCGFPYEAQYMQNTFAGGLACSKGYYSNYVLLQWNIVNNSSLITNVVIYRRPVSLNTSIFQLAAKLDASVSSWQDIYCESGTIYEYKVIAEGISGVQTENKTYVSGIGFRQMEGTATGRITYAGGTAVMGVSVIAETKPAIATSALQFSETNKAMLIDQAKNGALFTKDGNFSFQAWVQDTTTDTLKHFIFDESTFGSMYIQNNSITFSVKDLGDATILCPKKEYFHITAIIDGDSLILQLNDGKTVKEIKKEFKGKKLASTGTSPFYIGNNVTLSSPFKGLMKDVRFWSIALDSLSIQQNYDRVLAGTEVGLKTYYRCNEGVGSMAYDIVHIGKQYKANNATLVGGITWSNTTPSALKVKGVTDKDGNYIISGIPYTAEGSSYQFIPMMSQHSFNPSQALRYYAAGSDVSNNVDFTDKSSFTVSGVVKYNKTSLPVAGINVLIDGNMAFKNQKMVATNDSGKFTIDVPIGYHRITLAKQGHTFVGGYPTKDMMLPGADMNVKDSLYDFQTNSVTPLKFYDATLVTLVGRVAGGIIEQAKPLGFGLSKSNLGYSKIDLTIESSLGKFRTNNNDSIIDSTKSITAKIKSKYSINGLLKGDNTITIFPDTTTGEYTVKLPPGKYTFNKAYGNYFGNTDYEFTNKQLGLITLDVTKKDSSIYRFVDSIFVNKKKVAHKDSLIYRFNNRKDFIYRNTPTILITQAKQQFYGDSLIVFTNNEGKVTDSLKLIKIKKPNYTLPYSDLYYFGYPIFHQQVQYTFILKAFEEYENLVSKARDTIPQPQGDTVIIENSLSTIASKIDTIGKNGKLQYSFIGGEPNLLSNHLLTATFKYKYKEDNQTKIVSGPTIEGIILGGKSDGGSPFITTGPTNIDMILRDPPGSSSYVSLQIGNTITNTVTNTGVEITDFSLGTTIYGGFSTSTATGMGVMLISTLDAQNTIDLGLKQTFSHSFTGTHITTTTNTEQWSTSSDPAYVGSTGDVFIGHSNNIIYSGTNNVGIVKDIATNKYSLQIKANNSYSEQFKTAFKYSQSYIVNDLIPHLKLIRNNFYIQQPNVYVNHLPGLYENNPKDTTWVFQNNEQYLKGNVYDFHPAIQLKNNNQLDHFTDSIAVYNSWIAEWNIILARNEYVKVESIKLADSKGSNHSFDAGTIYQSTSTSEDSQDFSYTFHSENYTNLDLAGGFKVCGTGMLIKGHLGTGLNYDHITGKTSVASTTFNYVLQDNDQGDYLSVDVIPSTDGFGPVFRTRGGRTKCPYEGKETTQYYDTTGNHVLNVATEKSEIPYMLIDKNNIATKLDVPSTQQATFNLSLGNTSSSGVTGAFTLSLVQNSNPNGALVTIDGVSLTQNNGLAFYIPSPNGFLNKTLAIAKGPSSALEDTIGIVLTSSCGDASDTVFAIVHFTPACTPVTLVTPIDKWILNGITGSKLQLNATDYNKNESNFQSVSFEYKPSSSSEWKPLFYYFNDSVLYKSSTIDKDYKAILNGSTVSYNWDASVFANQSYDIRARANCANEITSYSNISSGVKDLMPLQLFGTPTPITGILGIGENIGVQFNKPIVAGKVIDEFVQVSAVLNGSPIAHPASINLDGASGYAKADGFSFTAQAFTVEFWMQRLDSITSGVIFAKGTSKDDKVEIATLSNNKFQVTLGTISYIVDPSPCFNSTVKSTSWHHYALVFDTLSSGTLRFFADDKLVLEKFNLKFTTQERSSIYIGRSVNADSFGKAFIDNVRIWNTARTLGELYANMNIQLSGSQLGLVAYWPLDEGTGTLAKDRAGSHTMTVNALWKIALANNAIQFDSTKHQALLIDARKFILGKEQNTTIEFWFKAALQANRACLLYNGLVDSTANGYNPKAFGLFLEKTGELSLIAGGVKNNVTNSNVSDDEWHHFALVIDRLSNVRSYLDGNLQSQLSTTLFSEIAGLDFSVGAYHKQTPSSVTKYYFTGSLDEFRIWGTTRQASLINKYMHTKLQGTETGLLFYFPFEYYFLNGAGTQSLGSTLKNQLVYNKEKFANAGIGRLDSVVAIKINDSQFSLQAPAVKDAQPTTSLPVSYVVNNDKLLINLPTQFASLYEKCILDVSVSTIYDNNGNILRSPIQWTAFINQNPVIWSKKTNSLTLTVGTEGTFTADVVNKSGVVKDFALNGLPVWLTANPDMGSLQPNSSQTITFTVNQGLNVGSYSQPINLTTDYGYDEKLQVDVNIKAKAPSWNVDASKYQYMMNVFGKVSINGVIATNENTLLAAFVNGECRGVTSLKYLSNFDITEAMLSIYNNSDQGETIELRIWDASTGKTYTNVTPVYTFVSDKVFGTPKTPELIACDNTLLNTYNLNAGWNWISVNVKNAKSNAVNNLFSSIGSTGDEIKSQKKGFDKFSKLAGWSGTLDTTSGINPAEMYKLKLTKAGVVTIGGKPFSPASTPVQIAKGWNWIGFVPQYNVSVNEALASYGPVDGDLVKSQKAFSMFYTGIGWIGSLTVLEPGKGYMLQSANASSLVYPEVGLLKTAIEQPDKQAPKVLAYVGGQAQSNTTVLAQLADETIDVQGKVLAAYNETACVGYASAVNLTSGKPLFFITADESSKLEFALVDIKTGLKTTFVNSLTTSGDSHIGQIDKPYLLYTSKTESGTDGKSELMAYPNPFQTKLVLQGNLLQDSPLSIRLFNDLGKELLTFNTSKAKGSYTIDLSSQSSFEKLPQGVYVVEVRSNDGTNHISVIKQ